jgi:hypothetical protein
MRRAFSLLVLGLVSLTAGPLAADKVVLRDGRTLETRKPPEIRGRQAVLTLADGSLVSIPAAEIDTQKTAAAAAKAGEAAKHPTAAPVAAKPPTLVDAARATREGKKAAVVLTDQDVAGGTLDSPEAKRAAGDGNVVVSNVAAKKNQSGTAVTGSVQNVGESTVEGVGVTIELVGENGKTVASSFGQLSADVLAPGETATFNAQMDTEATAQNVRVLPRWRAKEETKDAKGAKGESASGAGKAAAAKETPAAEATPVPKPSPAATPAPVLRSPDMPAPQANAPVGAPAKPGGSYVPQPSSSQPKPPGGS